MTDDREFTVEEANSLLPELSESLRRIKTAREVILAGAERLSRTASLDGGGGQGKEYWEALHTLRRELEQLTVHGIILRDADTGLVDFPTTRGGRPVFLCWKLGEDRVGHWHGPESGFAGRRPL